MYELRGCVCVWCVFWEVVVRVVMSKWRLTDRQTTRLFRSLVVDVEVEVGAGGIWPSCCCVGWDGGKVRGGGR